MLFKHIDDRLFVVFLRREDLMHDEGIDDGVDRTFFKIGAFGNVADMIGQVRGREILFGFCNRGLIDIHADEIDLGVQDRHGIGHHPVGTAHIDNVRTGGHNQMRHRKPSFANDAGWNIAQAFVSLVIGFKRARHGALKCHIMSVVT